MHRAINHVKTYFKALGDIIYPRTCPACGASLLRDEVALCISCHIDLPINPYFEQANNEVRAAFSGRLPLETANTLLYFNKNGIAQKLIHALKYEDNQAIGFYLGNLLGQKLLPTFKNVPEVIIPVPLHPDKEKLRGYNQCHSIAKGIAEALGSQVNTTAISRIKANPSQTKLNRAKRWDNVKGIFSLNAPQELEGKHVLLVDDTLTTGATLESCGNTALLAGNVKLSIATLAYAK